MNNYNYKKSEDIFDLNNHLDIISTDYKNFILKNLDINPYDHYDDQVKKLYRLNDEIKSSFLEKNIADNLDSMKEKKQNLFIKFGVIYFCLGVLLFLITNVYKNVVVENNVISSFDILSMMSLVISMSGLAFLMMSLNLSRKKRIIDNNNEFDEIQNKMLIYEVVNTWENLLNIGNQLTKSNLEYNPMKIFDLLEQQGIISLSDLQTINNFRIIRNNMIHSSNKISKTTYSSTKEEINRVNKIINELTKYHFYQ